MRASTLVELLRPPDMPDSPPPKKRQSAATTHTPQSRETWLRALSAADDPSHRAPTLVLYRILKLSSLIHRPFFADDAERYGIGMNELRVLMTLAPLREAASHELVTVAGMHPMNVSRAVAALRRRGRIQQRTDPNNRRRKLLQLTPEGLKLYKSLMPHVQRVADALFTKMDPDEMALLSRLIDMMTARLETAETPTGQLRKPTED